MLLRSSQVPGCRIRDPYAGASELLSSHRRAATQMAPAGAALLSCCP